MGSKYYHPSWTVQVVLNLVAVAALSAKGQAWVGKRSDHKWGKALRIGPWLLWARIFRSLLFLRAETVPRLDMYTCVSLCIKHYRAHTLCQEVFQVLNQYQSSLMLHLLTHLLQHPFTSFFFFFLNFGILRGYIFLNILMKMLWSF